MLGLGRIKFPACNFSCAQIHLYRIVTRMGKISITTASLHHNWHCACAIMPFAILYVQTCIQGLLVFTLLVSLTLPDPILGVSHVDERLSVPLGSLVDKRHLDDRVR